jgi:restriction system protein
MPVPDFQSIMLPFLEALKNGEEVAVRDLTTLLADRFNLTTEDRQQMLPSGEQTLFSNRVAWAKTHLKNAGLIDNPTRGRARIVSGAVGTRSPS